MHATMPLVLFRKNPAMHLQSSMESEPAADSECTGQLELRSFKQIVFAAHSTHSCASAERHVHTTQTIKNTCRVVQDVTSCIYRNTVPGSYTLSCYPGLHTASLLIPRMKSYKRAQEPCTGAVRRSRAQETCAGDKYSICSRLHIIALLLLALVVTEPVL